MLSMRPLSFSHLLGIELYGLREWSFWGWTLKNDLGEMVFEMASIVLICTKSQSVVTSLEWANFGFYPEKEIWSGGKVEHQVLEVLFFFFLDKNSLHCNHEKGRLSFLIGKLIIRKMNCSGVHIKFGKLSSTVIHRFPPIITVITVITLCYSSVCSSVILVFQI